MPACEVAARNGLVPFLSNSQRGFISAKGTYTIVHGQIRHIQQVRIQFEHLSITSEPGISASWDLPHNV